jgi:amidase/nitrilase
VFHREELVVGELDPRDRIVAKNVFDCMGHYSRWDVVSLRLSEEDHGPTGPTSVHRGRRIRWEELERVAEKHSLPPEKLESIARDLEELAIELEA